MSTQEIAVDVDEEQQPYVDDDLPPSPLPRPSYSSVVVERLKTLVVLEDLREENISEIRELLKVRLPESACGDEDLIAPLRGKLWSVMLLGLRPEDLNRQDFNAALL